MATNMRAFGEDGIPWKAKPQGVGGLLSDEEGGVEPVQLQGTYPGLKSFQHSVDGVEGGAGDQAAIKRILGGSQRKTLEDPGDSRRSGNDAVRAEAAASGVAVDPLQIRTPTRQESAQEDAVVNLQLKQTEDQQQRIAQANAVPTFDAQVYELDRQEKVLAAQERMRQAEFAADFFAKTGLPLTKENMALAENERKRDARDNDIEEIRAGFVTALSQAKTPEEELKVEKMYKAALRALTLRIAADDKKVSVNSRIDEKDDGNDRY